jgi:hypothetical protein
MMQVQNNNCEDKNINCENKDKNKSINCEDDKEIDKSDQVKIKKYEENGMTSPKRWPTFLICVAIMEIIIAVIASTGMGLNVLATSNGVADVKLVNTSVVIEKYYAHVSMKTDGYQFSGHFKGSDSTDNRFYSYKTAYHNNCGKGMPDANTNRDCKVRYAVWQWTRAYTALGTIAIIVLFVTGVVLLMFACFGECLTRCCRRKDYGDGKDNEGNNDKSFCLWQLCSCTAEIWLLMLNFLVFILFAFSWGIILGLKFNHHLKQILAAEADQALNRKSTIETYDFTFDTIKVGKSLWPLAVASLMCLFVSFYLLVMICCACCRSFSCENCEKQMKCNYNKNNNGKNNHKYNQNKNNYNQNKNVYNHNYQRTQDTTIEVASDDVQV